MTNGEAHARLIEYVRFEAAKLAASYVGKHLDPLGRDLNDGQYGAEGKAGARSRELLASLRAELTTSATSFFVDAVVERLVRAVAVGTVDGQTSLFDLPELEPDPGSKTLPPNRKGADSRDHEARS